MQQGEEEEKEVDLLTGGKSFPYAIAIDKARFVFEGSF